MQHQAVWQARIFGRLSINRIADDGRPFMMHVDADLVGATGVEVAQNQRGDRRGIGGQHFVVGDGRFPARRIDHRHFLAIHRMTPDMGENAVFFRFRDALGHREIEFFHRAALGKLGDQRLVGGVGLGHNQTTGSVLVQTMNNARALDSADAGKPALAMMQQRVDQRAIGISRRGMHHHAVRLVDHDEVVILEMNFQRVFLRRVDQRHGLGQRDGDEIAGFHRISRLGGMAVDDDELLADERLDARAREIRQARGKKRVEALGRDIGTNFHGMSFCGGKRSGKVQVCVSRVRIASIRP